MADTKNIKTEELNPKDFTSFKRNLVTGSFKIEGKEINPLELYKRFEKFIADLNSDHTVDWSINNETRWYKEYVNAKGETQETLTDGTKI